MQTESRNSPRPGENSHSESPRWRNVMSFLQKALYVPLTIVCLIATIPAQSLPPGESKAPALKSSTEQAIERSQTPQQTHALGVLNQLFDQVKTRSYFEYRIEIQSEIADLLWEYDQAAARRQFTEMFRSIDE